MIINYKFARFLNFFK